MRRSRQWWSSTVAESRSSGLTQVAFARDVGIHVNTLRWWIADAAGHAQGLRRTRGRDLEVRRRR
jgi:transposase-like protein